MFLTFGESSSMFKMKRHKNTQKKQTHFLPSPRSLEEEAIRIKNTSAIGVELGLIWLAMQYESNRLLSG